MILETTASAFWDLTFSSSENGSKFDSALNNSAVVGDAVGSGVMGLVKPSSGPLLAPIGLSDVSTKFGINSDNTPTILQSFFKSVDSTGTFTLLADLDNATRNAL